MAEFKIKKEKFDILLNLIAKTDNKELQNAFLDYQNEKNENNEGYLNYLKSVCEGGTSIREKAALPLQNVTNSLKAIELTHDEAKHVNRVIRDREDMDGEIVGYLLEVLMKIEQKFPDIES